MITFVAKRAAYVANINFEYYLYKVKVNDS